ncbi:nitrogen fixation protein NifQ [Afifella pfennigii]|uniref:nitrogen fixation protein NifQ n=1 Tax=Afifella pfennigii TaxID=209897 RepID=UPI00047C11AE|nr:nitrogen fixation protein NifQ [Afifella pfennigii]
MQPVETYDRLMAGRGGAADRFDCHVAASVLALAGAEEGGLCAGSGLAGGELAFFVEALFADAGWLLEPIAACEAPERGEEEASLLHLLQRFATGRSALEPYFAAMVARRAQRPNHLWQDLGLQSRDELGLLMRRHFAPLAARNHQDMKWKKFFYRTICADAAYALCTAPSCSECCDFEACFGEETGESLLARTRRAAEAAI